MDNADHEHRNCQHAGNPDQSGIGVILLHGTYPSKYVPPHNGTSASIRAAHFMQQYLVERLINRSCSSLRETFVIGGTDMAQMFAAIRRGKLKPGTAEEFAKRVEAGAVPEMKKMEGFKSYYLVFGADDTVIAVSIFTNKAVAEGSTQKLMPWIKQNLGPLLASPTEAIEGNVAIAIVG